MIKNGLLSLFQDALSGFASIAARWTIDPPCIGAKSKRSRPASSSSVEVVVKSYQAYRDRWAADLGPKIPCQREVFNRVSVS